MKNHFVATALCILISMLSSPVFAFGNGNGTAGSPHDFALQPWNGRAEICRVCHVPHDHNLATQRYLNGLLWNHGLSSATYIMYDNTWSPTLTGVQDTQPTGHSKLCLGCHDGTVGIDTFDKYAGGTIFIDEFNPLFKIPGFSVSGTLDMHGTHPIAIAFPAADVNEFTDPNVAT